MSGRPEEGDVKLDNLSREDLKKIEKSMKRPEFLGLLNEYMVEISDPKNKNEYDEYLRQLEREKQLPKHMKIVEIRPKFCFRTFLVSQKNKKHEMKFFVNMCESEYLEKPSCQPNQMEDGKIGYNWKVPNSMGKIRYDQDKKGSPCQVVDIAFHPDTYMFGVKKQFQEMMINIALEAAERQLGERKQTLSRDYIILKNLKCKGQDGKPALLPIRYIEGKMYNKGEGPNNQPERDNEGRETKLQKELSKQKEVYDKEKNQKEKAKEEDEQKEEELEQKPKLVVDLQQGVQRPKFSTIYTYPVDYAEFIDSPFTKRRTVPTVFNIQFAIPRVESMQEIAGQTLQINDKKILLKIGEKYFIDLQLDELKLKYVLITANAKAKYDKKKKVLRIIIPVDQTVKYESEKIEQEAKENTQQIVEDQTWKNKVLDFTEPNVSVKMLEKTEQKQEEGPKLIEEIDQEDIIEQNKTQIPKDEDEIQEQTPKTGLTKFTMSNYYNKPKKQVSVVEKRRIGFLFQETADKVVLVIQMKNYKKEDVRFLNIGNQEFLVLWDQGSKQEKSSFRSQHLKLNVQGRVQKVDPVFRVGFLAIMLSKVAEQKGKFWQKQSVFQIFFEGQDEAESIDKFLEYFELKQKQQEKDSQKENKIERMQQFEEIKAELQEPAVRQQVEAVGSAQQIFRNLQPQFIVFDAPFVYALD